MNAELQDRAAVFFILRLESPLTPTGVAKRMKRQRSVIQAVMRALEQEGHLESRLGELEPGDGGRRREYWISEAHPPQAVKEWRCGSCGWNMTSIHSADEDPEELECGRCRTVSHPPYPPPSP